MKKSFKSSWKFSLILFLLLSGLTTAGLSSCHDHISEEESETDNLYHILDSEIEDAGKYEAKKERRISALRNEFLGSSDENHRHAIVNKLIEEYDAYNADSALYYININLLSSDRLRNQDEKHRLQIKRADVYAHAGLFSDALATLGSFPRDSISGKILEDYYSTYCALYQYLSEYTSEHETYNHYEQQRSLYTDSLNSVIDKDSFNYMVYVMTEKARNGEPQMAIDVLESYLDNYPSGSRKFSIIASTLAYIYHTTGNEEEHQRYLVLSAISDIRGAVKENMSFRAVATLMFEQGDVERANRYLKKSIADANFYSARMRNAQSGVMLPIIDDAYVSIQKSLNSRLRVLFIISACLAIILLITVILILRQFRNLRQAKDNLSKAHEELHRLSRELKEINSELQSRNNELSLFNRTKEQYAGLFMEYCSSAISSLKSFRLSLRNAVNQGMARNLILKKLDSSDISDELLKNFYTRFDEAILNIYPDFINNFNNLLLENQRIVLKGNELLNTELRIFALIRIGIDDTTKISEFLRCSTATIYTYRSKMRKRAKDPADFENNVRKLGT